MGRTHEPADGTFTDKIEINSNMGKLKYLSKNIVLFSISNFVSKILVFLLVPFYTNVLTTYEYGVADIIQVTLLLLVPALTVNIGEAALRFGIEETDNRPQIFKIGVKYVLRAEKIVAAVGIPAYLILGMTSFEKKEELKWYIFLFMILFLANAFYEYFVYYFQGAEAVEIIVIGSISCTALTIAFNLFFLLGVKIGLNGYLFSQILAFSMAALLMYLLGRRRGITTESAISDENNVLPDKVSDAASGDDKEDTTELNSEPLETRMVAYGRPMIVYAVASWINNAIDRYFVLFLCGTAVNGIYGVAYKIPAILMVFQRIFAQAWQLSATKAHKDEDSEEFFTDMYRTYNSFMVLGCSFLVLIVKLLASFLFRKEFYEAWKFVPPLLISVIFGALTGFLGSICLAHKDSKSMGKATGIGALVNIALNLLLIPSFAAMGAAVATAVSYCTMSTMALIFVLKHAKIKVSYLRNAASYVLLIVQSVIMIMEVPYHYALSGLIFIILSIMYFGDLISIIKVFLNKLTRGKENV